MHINIKNERIAGLLKAYRHCVLLDMAFDIFKDSMKREANHPGINVMMSSIIEILSRFKDDVRFDAVLFSRANFDSVHSMVSNINLLLSKDISFIVNYHFNHEELINGLRNKSRRSIATCKNKLDQQFKAAMHQFNSLQGDLILLSIHLKNEIRDLMKC